MEKMSILKRTFLAGFFAALSFGPVFAQEGGDGLVLLKLETDASGRLQIPEPAAGDEDVAPPPADELEEPQEQVVIEPVEAPAEPLPSVDDFMAQMNEPEDAPDEEILQKITVVEEAPVVSEADIEREIEMAAPLPPVTAPSSVMPPSPDIDENVFFDANSLVPQGEMASGAPHNVNPRTEPASKLVVVTRNAGADSVQAQLVSADRAMKLGRYESALALYEQAYAVNRHDPNVLLGRAMAYQKLGQDDAALQSYEEVLALRPDNVEAQINMLGLMSRQYPAVALRRLIELRERNPNHPAIVAQIAVVQAQMGQYNEALQYLGMAAAMEPKNALHLFNMAVIADRNGHKTEAIRYYERALEVDAVYGGSRSIPREAVFERLASLR